MLAEAVTVDGQQAPPGEQSSEASASPADAFVRSLALPAAPQGQCRGDARPGRAAARHGV